jgi:hypothetical protein
LDNGECYRIGSTVLSKGNRLCYTIQDTEY